MDKKIVIGHFLYSLGKGGMENGVVKLINFSSKEKYRHIIISLKENISLRERLEDTSVKIYVIEGKSIIKRITQLYKIIRQEKINIMHARGWPTMFETVILKIICPGLTSIFAFHGRIHEELEGRKLKRYIAQIIFARFINQIVTLTESMQEELAEEFKISRKKIKVVHNGVLQKKFDEKKRSQIRSEFNILESEIVIGCVGRLDPVKGIETIIDAFNKYYEKQNRGYLFIVGEGEEPYYAYLKSKVRNLKSSCRIILTGFKTDVEEFIQMFDIYVQTSLYEGLSNTILEAMSAGLPIIVRISAYEKSYTKRIMLLANIISLLWPFFISLIKFNRQLLLQRT